MNAKVKVIHAWGNFVFLADASAGLHRFLADASAGLQLVPDAALPRWKSTRQKNYARDVPKSSGGVYTI